MKEYKYKINGNEYKVSVGDIDGNVAKIEVNGTPYNVEIEERQVKKVAPVATVKTSPTPAAPAVKVATPAAATGGEVVKSPLPGVINDIKVKVGDAVKAGQVVVILEAMKMENNINASKDGVIKSILVNKGDSVLEGTDLLVIE